ncbi:choline dehydrogenase [Subtercola boreus]|uniref:Choline dehydrogenase n=1 Tax=Subtercola boreus TaxID=120213 RepID=A0A3E0VFL1_9MICO|nr:GMC oxidoreductase [Subtercola boreus]RFA08160.1 choline dehydrogenase [Subtercola boreus]TQL54950.1 choline dehydrogenase-like flavoprotein [Subtercola boreus]
MSGRFPASVDVAIVGSGPTGAAYARILSESAPGARIALFEAGPIVSDPPGAHVKNIADPDARARAQRASQGSSAGASTISSPGAVTSGQRSGRPGTHLLETGFQAEGEDGLPVAAMSTNVGGMSAHWTGACPTPRGSERITFLPDLDELLGEAARLLGVTTDAFDGSPFAEIVRDRLAAVVDEGRAPGERVQRMPLAAHRRDDGNLVWSGSDVVLGEAATNNPDFALYPEALVTRVLRGGDGAEGAAGGDGARGDGARGIAVRDLRTGETTEVAARFVVVAGDALRTPQLLWASGIRPEALGRYLNDQAQIVFAARLRGVEGLDAGHGASSTGLSEYSGVTWVPYTDAQPFHGQVMQLDASPVPLAEDDPVTPGSIVGLGLFCAKDLQASDRVEFSEGNLDDNGMPAPSIRYTLTEKDHETFARASDRIVVLGRAVGELLNDRPFRLPLGSSLHYQGTTRMGLVDDGTSVCDTNSAVWGAPGLHVAGNGVIPTATACNPTLTSVALAVRGARHIASQLMS